MRTKFEVGESFLTNQEMTIYVDGNDVEVPEDTLFTIIEYMDDEEPYSYKVYFEGYGNPETDWLRMSFDYIEDVRKSAMCEY